MSEKITDGIKKKAPKKSSEPHTQQTTYKDKSDFDRNLDVKIIELEAKIKNKAPGDHIAKGEDEKRRLVRGLKLDKLSDYTYAVKSYGYSMEFNVDKQRTPNMFTVRSGMASISSEKIENILTICNMINFGMYTVGNNIKDSKDYLNNYITTSGGERTDRKDSRDIFKRSGHAITIKPNPKQVKNNGILRNTFSGHEPCFYSIWNDVDADGSKRKHGRNLMTFDEFNQFNSMLNYKVNEIFRANNDNGTKAPVSSRIFEDKTINAG